jgi:tetratricopeptide (TPR) repeat protein
LWVVVFGLLFLLFGVAAATVSRWGPPLWKALDTQADPIQSLAGIITVVLTAAALVGTLASIARAKRPPREEVRQQEAPLPDEGPEPAGHIIPLPPEPYFAHPYPLQENFTGRDQERGTLTEWFTSGREPLFAYVAIGGMGKSALTWAWVVRDVLGLPLPGAADDLPETAAACRVPEAARPEGVLWWSFYEREAGFPAFLDRAILYAGDGTLDPKAIASDYDKVAALVNLLAHRRFLVVLDGFERQLRAYARLDAAYVGERAAADAKADDLSCTDPHAAEFLKRLAATPTQSRILITTRLFPRELEGLAGCRRVELMRMDPADAVEFFRARGVRKGTRAEIQAACAPYDYLPLALRLLSGVIACDKRTPGDISVADRYPVLPELKGKEQHHILEVAYDTLTKPNRTLLSLVAAFRSPVDYDAVALLSPYKGKNKSEKLNAAIDELTARGLIFFDRGKAQYDLHPIVRQYAYDRLRDKEGVHTRLRDYFAAVPQAEKVDSLADLAPVIELYHHTVRAGRFDDACDLFYARLAEQLYYRFGAYTTCIELLRGLFPDGEDKSPRLKKESDQAWTLNTLAASYSLSGQPRRAVPLLELQNALRQKAGDKSNLAIGLGNLADDQAKIGELAAAEENFRRSIALCHEIQSEFDEAVGHQQLGRLLAYEDAVDRAGGELVTALASLTQLDAPQSQCVVWSYRALSALLVGDAPAALNAARKARELADEVARKYYPFERDFIRAEWLLGWTHVALALDDKSHKAEHLAEAETRLTEALTRCRRINMVDHEPDILLAWARWHRAKGDPGSARAAALEALSIADRSEYRLVQADCRNFLARLALDSGDEDTARKEAGVARERAWCDGPPHSYKPALDEADRLLAQL